MLYDVCYFPEDHIQFRIPLKTSEEILLKMQVDSFFTDGWVHNIKERIEEDNDKAEKEKILYQI